MYFGEASSSQVPDEHTFLCGYNRIRKYGTTKSLQETTPQHHFIYLVQPADTLQGIALRHNCSVSEIIRMNKLWSADALHLKETIRIPLRAENGNNRSDISHPPPPPSKIDSTVPCQTESESLHDILSRIDKSIKKTSKSAKSIERFSSLNHSDDSPSPRHNSLRDLQKSVT